MGPETGIPISKASGHCLLMRLHKQRHPPPPTGKQQPGVPGVLSNPRGLASCGKPPNSRRHCPRACHKLRHLKSEISHQMIKKETTTGV